MIELFSKATDTSITIEIAVCKLMRSDWRALSIRYLRVWI
jgi:hypothetical protein